MMYRQFTMHNSRCTIGKRRFCRGELRSPVRDVVIRSSAKNLEVMVEAGGKCE